VDLNASVPEEKFRAPCFSPFSILLSSAQTMHTLKFNIPTARTRYERHLRSMQSLGTLLAVTLASGCGGGASDTFSGPETLKIKAVSATSFTGQMGDVVTVALDVDALNDDAPPFGTKVTFVASDGGTTSPLIAVSPGGSASTTWRLGPAAKVQTLTASVDGARPLVFRATVTGNAWNVTTVGSMRYVTRLADEGSIGAGTDPWASTMFGSAPRLTISCQAGTVGIALAHPKMAANGNWVAYSFNGADSYTQETWSLAPQSDSLFHPGPTTAAGALAKQIAASSVFRLVYRQYFPSGNFTAEVTPTFGTAGLAQVMPQLMANCSSGR
jgi:hypothetical protein